jgi:pre-mRNA-splicing factor ATP-dependent RNA helicase DHX16
MTIELPQYLLVEKMRRKKSGDESMSGLIAVTQPRRVAAITIAKRVSQELGVKLGGMVR